MMQGFNDRLAGRGSHGDLEIRLRAARPFAVLTLTLALAFPLVVAGPAETATVAFDPAVGSIVCDETLAVDVTIDASVTDLRGFTFVFEFDPAVIMPISAVAGALETGAGCPNFFTWLNSGAIGDSIAVDGATLGCSVAGPGAIARIEFVGVAAGVSTLECRQGAMRDSQNAPIPFTCVPGSIAFSCQTPVESGTWGRIKTLYR